MYGNTLSGGELVSVPEPRARLARYCKPVLLASWLAAFSKLHT